jgi:hypothetical protein
MGRSLRWIFASLAVLFATLGVVVVRQQGEIFRLHSALSAQAAQLADNQSQLQALADRVTAEQQGRLAAGQALRRTAAENIRLAEALGLNAGDLSFWEAERLKEAGRRYAASLDHLDLSPERRDALLGLLADRTDAMRDAREIAVRDGIGADSAEMVLAVRMAAAEVDTDIRGLIGGAIDGFFPAAPPAAAPAVTVAVYNSPPAIVPVYSEPAPVAAYAPEAYAPAPDYAPYAPVLFVSSFRPRGFDRAPRFAGPRSEPARPLAPPRASGFGRALPSGSRGGFR